MLVRLCGEPNSDKTVETDTDFPSQPVPDSQLTHKIPLQIEINHAIKHMDNMAHTEKVQRTPNLLATIKKEMGLFEAGGSRGHHLQMAYDHILTECRS